MSRPKKPETAQTKVVQMDGTQAGNVAVAEPDPQTPFDTPMSRPNPIAGVQPVKKLTFFQKVGKVEAPDWGTRAFIYVYCWEPICNLKMGGENKYLVRLSQPIHDEQALMIDYGSGKYHLKLVIRKPGGDEGDTVDTTEIEIYNPKYPPKIPRAVWMNDPRNERWAALLPKEEPANGSGANVLMDSMKVLNEIRRDAREEMSPATAPPVAVVPPPDPVAQFQGMLRVAKEMMPPPVAPATDNKVLDTVVQLMMKQLDASQQETKELRQELRDVMKSKQSTSGETLETMFDKFEKMAPRVQSLLGLAGDKATDVVHGRRRPWYEELAISALPQLAPGFNALMGAAAGAFFAPKGQQALGAPSPAPQSQAALPAPADPLQALRQKVGMFMQSNIKPLQKHFEDYIRGVPRDEDDASVGKKDGTDFAYWVNESFGMDDLKAARELGSANIKAMFQQSPFWPAIAPYEQKFSEFLDQVLSFQPDEEDKPEEDGKPVDLTEE